MLADRPIRILCLGDSYTVGEGVAAAEGWPSLLAERLADAGSAVEAPHVVARTGWTAGELLAALEASPVPGAFDLVTLMAGVNDQYRGLPLDAFSAALASVAAIAVAAAGGRRDRVLVLSVPDWGRSPFAADRDRSTISHEIDRFNDAAAGVARAARLAFVDVTAASRRATGVADFAADGLHPSAAQYRVWLEQIAPAVLQALGLGSDRQHRLGCGGSSTVE